MTAMPGVHLNRLSVPVAGREVIDGLTLSIRPGTVVGLVGPNGCGKSTLLRSLYRAARPRSGTIVIDGRSLAELSFGDSAKLVAALPQEERTELDFTVAEVVALGATAGTDAAPDQIERAVRRALERTGMSGHADRSVLGLSGGERQRTLVARAFAQRARYLLLDEPTNHLDLRHQLDLSAEVRRYVHESPSPDPPAAVLALHDLNLAAGLCDRVVVMSEGAVVADGAPEESLDPGIVETVYGVRPTLARRPDTGAPHLFFPLTQTQEDS